MFSNTVCKLRKKKGKLATCAISVDNFSKQFINSPFRDFFSTLFLPRLNSNKMKILWLSGILKKFLHSSSLESLGDIGCHKSSRRIVKQLSK